MPRENDARTVYRLLQDPPIRFHLWGSAWEIVVEPMPGTGGSRAHLSGPKLFYLTGGSAENTLRHLRVEGISIPDRSLPGTIFRHLEREGLVERVHASSASAS